MSATHDRGGWPGAGPINRAEHDLADWELKTDAILRVEVVGTVFRYFSGIVRSFVQTGVQDRRTLYATDSQPDRGNFGAIARDVRARSESLV